MSKAQQQVSAFLGYCARNGLRVERATTRPIVRVVGSFDPGDRIAYQHLDGVAATALAMVAASGGSVWGSTSDGVGGAVALRDGVYVLNVSGVQKRFLAALVKSQGAR